MIDSCASINGELDAIPLAAARGAEQRDEDVRRFSSLIDAAEPPQPLLRELPPADPYPIEALGTVLAPAGRAIHEKTQAPLAMTGQSVLAAATLAVQAHANIELPTGQLKPLSGYYLSVAATGERKTAVDREALWPIHQHEAALRETYTREKFTYEKAECAWKEAREQAIKKAKGDREAIQCALDMLGPAPRPPLQPVLTCGEPTYEGLCKLLAVGQPSMGIFASEGGQFIGGHGMSNEAKLRTATGLSVMWDGEPIKRIRATDGFAVLHGRRVSMHLMVQPDVASMWLADSLLLNQGFLSRVLATAPEPTSGRRFWKGPSAESEAVLRRYGARLLDIQERPMPLADGTQNELAPRRLPLSAHARTRWIRFHDHVEGRLIAGGELESIRGLANKLPEHAARIAGVLTLIGNIEAVEVGDDAMEAGIALAQHYAAEGLRMFGAAQTNADLRTADRLRKWLHNNWNEPYVSLPDIYQRGPADIRDASSARHAVNHLVEHGWLVSVSAREVAGTARRDVWRLVKG